eukprot:TRINITY_DN5531_c0_g1_i1.p1 TRINITY_DN5531_c0_g1~~TRINITY_DN5531_c0_g1_i1.p1  ORF type:complete len:251 (+),score=39.75 TRINITY_DN5531_c0_g1_i1:47-799(+)
MALLVLVWIVMSALTQNFLCAFPLLVGHRGSSSTAPENTIASFSNAIKQGCDGIETDLRLTKDGVIVLIHDESLDRTTNGKGLVSDMTLHQLQQLDAGCWKGREFCGNRIPTFAEFLRLIKETSIFVIMDLKVDGLGPYIKKELDFAGFPQDRVIASCWTIFQVRDARKHLPSARFQLLGNAPSSYDSDYWSGIIKAGVSGFSLDFETVTSEFVECAHRHLVNVMATCFLLHHLTLSTRGRHSFNTYKTI